MLFAPPRLRSSSVDNAHFLGVPFSGLGRRDQDARPEPERVSIKSWKKPCAFQKNHLEIDNDGLLLRHPRRPQPFLEVILSRAGHKSFS
jgi:hypothetical protein